MRDHIAAIIDECLLLAQSRHGDRVQRCPLLGVKRTSRDADPMSAFDPKWTSAAQDCCACTRQPPMVSSRIKGRSLRRRDFITRFGSVAAGWPLAARAQQSLPLIGFMTSRSAKESRRRRTTRHRSINLDKIQVAKTPLGKFTLTRALIKARAPYSQAAGAPGSANATRPVVLKKSR